MTQLVLEELGRLDQILGSTTISVALKVDLNLTTTASTVLIGLHMYIEFHDRIFVCLCPNVKHKAQLWLQVLADSLKEPLVRIDFAIVSVFDSEANVDTSTFEDVIVKTYIPCCHLPDVQ